MPSLLAIDLGLRTGLALYNQDGRLRWYRSRHFGNAAQLRRGVRGVLKEIHDLAWLVVEGSGPLAEIWAREAERQQVAARQVRPEEWRETLLLPREQRTGIEAKQNADDLARRVIEWSGARRPTSLRHDAAEAILIGLWGVLKVGWLENLPAEVKR
jgi:hypothetical protein